MCVDGHVHVTAGTHRRLKPGNPLVLELQAAIGASNQTWALYRQYVLLATEPFLQPIHIREGKEGKEKREGGRESKSGSFLTQLTNFMPNSWARYWGCDGGGSPYPLRRSGTNFCCTSCAYRHLVKVTWALGYKMCESFPEIEFRIPFLTE